MAKRVLKVSNWSGGQASDTKEGLPNSFGPGSQSIDFRRRPTLLTLLPRTVKDSGSTVTTAVRDVVSVPYNDGDTYWAGGTKFYKRTGAGVWSTPSSSMTDACGLVHRPDQDALIIADQTSVHKYFPVSNSPSLTLNKYGASKDQSLTGGALTYQPPTSINEGATHRQTFSPDVEPLYSVKVYVTAKGTGDWTLTIHDDGNNVIGSKTIVNASLTNGALNEFIFATPLRQLVAPNGRTYHFHLTSTVADGTAQVATVNDLETADFESWANRLVSSTYHPVVLFQQYVCIGNERYLSVWEPLSDAPSNTEWNRHRLTFPSDVEVIGLSVYNEYLAIACRRNRVVGTAGAGAGDGVVYFWDGASTTFNFLVDVPEGPPHSISNFKNRLEWIANGVVYEFDGQNPVPVKRFPNFDDYAGNDTSYEQAVNAMTVWRGLLHIGFPRKTLNTQIPIGVYSYGSRDKNYGDAYGFDYPISTGTISGSGNTGITLVKAFSNAMFIGWQDGASTYGVDIVQGSHSPFASAKYESLIFDNGTPYHDKIAETIIVTCKDLPANATITPKWRLDRDTWLYGDAVSTTGVNEAKFNIGTGGTRFREIEIGCDVTCTTVAPDIICVTLEFDDLEKERKPF